MEPFLFHYRYMTLTRFVQGVAPVLNCNGNALKEVSWYFNVRGSVIDGKFIPTGMPVHFLNRPASLICVRQQRLQRTGIVLRVSGIYPRKNRRISKLRTSRILKILKILKMRNLRITRVAKGVVKNYRVVFFTGSNE